MYERTKGDSVTRLSIAAISAFVFLATCTSSEAQKKAPEVRKIREVWYEFEFAGSKIGYIKAVDEQTSVNGRPAYHLHRWSKLSVKRQHESVEISSSTDSWFGLDGVPMRFKHHRQEGGEKRSIEGYRDGNMLVVRQAIGKNLTEKRIPIADDLRLSSSLEVLFPKHLQVGKVLTGRVFDETQGDVLPYRIEVQSVTADKIYAVHQTIGPIKADVQVAADGTILDVVLPDMGVRQKKVTRAQAVQEAEAVDLFSAALFRLPQPLPPRGEIEKLIVRLSSKKGRAIDATTDARQRARPVSKTTELAIRVQSAPRSPARRPIKQDKWASYLRSTEYEPLDDEALRATSTRLTAGTTDVWSAAKKINAFVYGHIKDKTLARAYASAPEALASREGDCTEHAVLFSALAKIAGIPTRLVTGLVYVGGPDNVFGYHEWVEIWTGQEWLAMDPTFGQDIADATHIKLHAGLSDAEGLRAAGQVAAGAIGDLEINVIAYVDGSGRRRSL